MKLNIHYYQHANHEGPAYIQKWADQNGHNLTRTNFKNNDTIPNPDLYDVLIVLGGPMSVNDESKFPWLIQEKRSINRALNDGKKVIGICLGAQMLANVLGAKVYKGEYSEIGWHKINFSENRNQNEIYKIFPDELTTFHWHSETFDLPSGTNLIASSDAYPNQIFSYGELAVGFQCHLEQNEWSIGRIIERTNDKLNGDGFVQTKEQILSQINFAIENNNLLNKFLDNFCQ